MIVAAPATATAAVGWGINLDGPLPPGQPEFSYETSPYFTELLGGMSCSHPNGLCYARLLVPWDAINDGKGSFAAGTCARSPSGPGTPDALFEQEVSAAARAVGASHVLVALTMAGNPADDIWPTDAEYQCGLSGLERQAPGVRDWEVFNEPDSIYYQDSHPAGGPDCTRRNGVWVSGASAGNGGAFQAQCLLATPAKKGVGANGHGGNAQAAANWYLDAKQADPNPDHTLVAGGFNYGSSRCTPSTCYYLGAYLRALSRIYPHPPDAIALNPYLDVNYAALNGGNPVPPASTGLPSGQGAIVSIDQFYPSHPQVWFTEVGVWLTDMGKEAVTSACGNANPQDAGTWAGCLNGNPNAQALAAEGYLRLPSESSQVTRVFYYDFDNQNSGWDSGLVNLSGPLLGSHGYGTPRTAWCVLHAFAQGASPSAAASAALRPGSPCDYAQHGNAPAVDAAYLSDPLTVPASAETPGQIGRDDMLIVADGVRILTGALTG